MRFFLKTKKFRIMAVTAAVIVALFLCLKLIGGIISPASDLLGSVFSPIQTAFSDASHYFSDLNKKLNDGEKLLAEKKELQEQLSDMRKQIADYDDMKSQNEFYKNYLDIKEENPDYEFCDAKLISRDKDDNYSSFTVNKGTLNGVSAYDPVIIDNYLVGYISEAGLTTSKVTTVLSPSLTFGANDARTDDAGVISGNASLAENGYTKFYNLPPSCTVAVGDYICTSGEGIFPSSLLIGTVESIKSNSYSSSIYAEVKPFADFDDIRNVMIITYFGGQGGLGE